MVSCGLPGPTQLQADFLPYLGAASPDPNAKTPGGQNAKEQEYETLSIIIDYDLRDPKDGIQVVKPSDLYPHVRAAQWQRAQQLLNTHCRSAYHTAILRPLWLMLQDAGSLALIRFGRDALGS